MTSHMNRRDLLRLGLGAGATALGLSVGTTATAPCARAAEGQMVSGSFASRYRNGQQTAWEVLYPPGYGPGSWLPVLICLHGTGGDQRTPESLRFFEHAATLASEGYRPFACVGVAGGDTWWHGHADGNDSSAMVAHELIPLLQGMGLDASRPAIYGLSMGGVGAIWLGSWLYTRGQLASLVVSSAPVIEQWDRFPGAYDSLSNFAYNDVRQRWGYLYGAPIRVDIGTSDPFYAENLRFFPNASPRPEFTISPGGHDWDYWSRMALNQFRFVASRF